MSKQLYIVNEESVNTTFRNRQGASNIDLTVISNQLLKTVVGWEVSERESCSDHTIIKYVIGQGISHRNEVNFQDIRHKLEKDNYAKFQENLLRLAETKLYKLDNEEGIEDPDTHFVHAYPRTWTSKSP
jgi:hypothetical protein